MSFTVDRTCTELRPGSDGRVERGESGLLRTFGSLDAYVLLGDPGAGKTTEFKRECRALGEAAEYVSARNFIRLDLESHSEWQDKTLFIDGLDEMRAGAVDSRVPLDEIRNRLERLGRPRFRISCREADWLGDNDRRSLEAVSCSGDITVLRLDPLSQEAVTELLRSPGLGVAAEGFPEEARTRGIGALLGNPLTLRLLADAFRHGGGWPASRLETFETACRQLAIEENEEHRVGSVPQPAQTVLDTAGYLCALLLLSGMSGCSLAPDVERSAFVSLDAIVGRPEHHSRNGLKNALATRLFAPVGDRAFGPVHRLVAEFLAGRYLADLIRRGLPARRVVGLMVGGSDGRVVTVLRGLSAWLAAHPGKARRRLIETDPVGVGIYGDISGFTTDDKVALLQSLAEFAVEAPLSGHQWRDDRRGEGRYDSTWAFRSLVSADMAPAIKELLRTRGGGVTSDRTIEFLLDLLSEVDWSEVEPLAVVTPNVEMILRGDTTVPRVRRRALDAYLRLDPAGDAKADTLAWLLEAVGSGEVPDPGTSLRGTLLTLLYPNTIAPSQVWRYFLSPDGPDGVGGFSQFWSTTLIERSSGRDVAELLDALHADAARLIPELDESQFEDLPIQLLERGLDAFGGSVELERLDNWLCTVGRLLVTSLPGDRAGGVRAWLEARPDTQTDLYVRWLIRRNKSPRGAVDDHWRCSALFESKLPSDFGLRCLDQAIAITDTDPAVAVELLSESYRSLHDPARAEGLSLEVLVERTRGRQELAQHIDELSRPKSGVEPADQDRHSDYQAALDELEARRAQARDEQRQRREEWADLVRAHETELRENRFAPPGLDALAKAYFGLFVGIDQRLAPRSRIVEFIGGDRSLVDIVMAGLREAVTRDDVPAAERTVSLHRESKHAWLAYPVLASLHLLNKEDPARLDGLDDAVKRNALAIHYCVPLGLVPARWHDRWLRENPELVLEVLYECAVVAIRAGDDVPPGLNDLDGVTGYDDRVRDVRLRLLRAFPTRGSQKQLGVLDRMLADVAEYPAGSALQDLISRKLASKSMTIAQRARWVAVEALLSPGSGFPHLKAWLGGSDRRIRHLAEFFRNISARFWQILDARGDPTALADTIEILGHTYHPLSGSGLQTLEMDASDRLSSLIDRLGSLAGDEAQRALRHLVDDPQLAAWKDRLTWSLERQRVIHRDASYRHPTLEEVQSTLSDQAPANVADLAALLVERLHDIAADVRGGNSNLWRQFWNEDEYRGLAAPKHENSCRDALLQALKGWLPSEVDAVPEGSYAADKRADIRVGRGTFNVPIEIKKNSHIDLWNALRGQLLDRYTTDPATSGFGIFLVLWFGEGETKRPPDGGRPSTTAELTQRLEKVLTPDEARKVSVVVIDVTKP